MLNNSVSLKFKHMSNNTIRLAGTLLENQNFLKWITYIEDFPLKMEDVDSASVINNQFKFTQFYEEALTHKDINVFFSPYMGKFPKRSAISRDLYCIDIVIPNHYAFIPVTFQMRAFEIAYEIISSLDGQSIAGMGQASCEEWKYFKITKEHICLRLIISITNATMKQKVDLE